MASHPLAHFRKEQQLTRLQLAKLLDVQPSTVWRWETGKRKVGIEELARIAEKTGIARADLRPDLAEAVKEVVL